MIINGGNEILNIAIENEKIEQVKSYKYLGINIDAIGKKRTRNKFKTRQHLKTIPLYEKYLYKKQENITENQTKSLRNSVQTNPNYWL